MTYARMSLNNSCLVMIRSLIQKRIGFCTMSGKFVEESNFFHIFLTNLTKIITKTIIRGVLTNNFRISLAPPEKLLYRRSQSQNCIRSRSLIHRALVLTPNNIKLIPNSIIRCETNVSASVMWLAGHDRKSLPA